MGKNNKTSTRTKKAAAEAVVGEGKSQDAATKPIKVPKIRKRKRKAAGNLRRGGNSGTEKVGISADDSDSDVGAGDTVAERVAEMRAMQKDRVRRSGLESRKLLKPASAVAATTASTEISYGLQSKEDYEAQQEKDAIINGTAFAAGDTTEKQVDKHMLEYVESKLGIKKKAGGEAPVQQMTEEDQLYLLPEHLKVDEANWKGSEIDGGQLLSGTGILEVRYKNPTLLMGGGAEGLAEGLAERPRGSGLDLP